MEDGKKIRKKDFGIKIGEKFGSWTVLEINKYIYGKKHGVNGLTVRTQASLCMCSCDNKTIKLIPNISLIKNITSSCKKCSRRKYNKYVLTGEIGIGYTSDDKEFYFDLEDYDKIKNTYWRYKNGRIEGRVNNSNTQIAMHRYLLNINDRNILLDHKDRNPFNNIKSNLRIATHLENSINKSITSRNKSGIIGVHWQKRDNKWCAQISYKSKTYSLGYFKDIKNATKTRLEAELKYFGKDFAPQRHLFKEYGVDVNE